MTPGAKQLLGQVLKGRGWVTEGQIQEALSRQRDSGGTLGRHLVEAGAVTDAQLSFALAIQGGMAEAETLETTDEATSLLDAASARTFGLLPLSIEDDVLVIAMGDPAQSAVLDDLRFTLGREIRGVLADPALLAGAIEAAYGARPEAPAAADADGAEAAPVVRLLNQILYQAIRDRASDVHFEPYEDRFRIRYRVDGALYEVESPPSHLGPALLSRIKIMSDLDISETRLPQDGRIELTIDGRPVDLRVATLPTMFGESCVLRVLDRSVVALDLDNLGIDSGHIKQLRSMMDLPHGIVLVTGPTGSGKTTTLYAMLNEANDPGVKFITCEDPVEYDLDGIVQIPVLEDIGVTYASILRTILRQDPDKILVGEIRDRETAQTAVEASLTGHTVFSTVHTNDAASAVTRLVDIGVPPFLINATLEAVVAQRLVRRICEDCKEAYEPDDEVLGLLGIRREVIGNARFSLGAGCESCFRSGYRGRMAIMEVLSVSDAIRGLIQSTQGESAIRTQAVREGMTSLREAGLQAVLDGHTTAEEVARETPATTGEAV